MSRYNRTPSNKFLNHLLPGGFLAPLLVPREVGGLRLDVQLRETDHLHVYCGLTRLIDAWAPNNGIRLSAHDAYSAQPCAGALFREWATDEQGFAAAINQYLSGVKVRKSFLTGEGAVQVAWAAVRSPWMPFDREAVLGYDDTASQTAARTFPPVKAARDEVERARGAGNWAAIPEGKVAAELDQLAVDPEGRLVLIELKDATSSSASIYYAPLQLLQYVHEWTASLGTVRENLGELMLARKKIGLSPADAPALNEGIRPVIGFGADLRSAEVKRRFKVVMDIANKHRPAGTMPIEVWAMEGTTPEQVA